MLLVQQVIDILIQVHDLLMFGVVFLEQQDSNGRGSGNDGRIFINCS